MGRNIIPPLGPEALFFGLMFFVWLAMVVGLILQNGCSSI